MRSRSGARLRYEEEEPFIYHYSFTLLIGYFAAPRMDDISVDCKEAAVSRNLFVGERLSRHKVTGTLKILLRHIEADDFLTIPLCIYVIFTPRV